LGFELEKIASELVNEGVPQATSPEAKIAEVPMNSLRDFINLVVSYRFFYNLYF